jgi:hypothetical protein
VARKIYRNLAFLSSSDSDDAIDTDEDIVVDGPGSGDDDDYSDIERLSSIRSWSRGDQSYTDRSRLRPESTAGQLG